MFSLNQPTYKSGLYQQKQFLYFFSNFRSDPLCRNGETLSLHSQWLGSQHFVSILCSESSFQTVVILNGKHLRACPSLSLSYWPPPGSGWASKTERDAPQLCSYYMFIAANVWQNEDKAAEKMRKQKALASWTPGGISSHDQFPPSHLLTL